MVSKGNQIITDISFLFSLFFLFSSFSLPCRCFSSSWSSPVFPWFCWHRPLRPYGNWRKMVTRHSWFSLEARCRPGFSGSLGKIRLRWETLHWGFLARAVTVGKRGYMSFPCWRCLYCLAFTLDDREGAFSGLWWKWDMDFASITKNQLYRIIKIPKWGIRNARGLCPVISHSSTRHSLLAGHRDDLPLTKHCGESIAFRLPLTWVQGWICHSLVMWPWAGPPLSPRFLILPRLLTILTDC